MGKRKKRIIEEKQSIFEARAKLGTESALDLAKSEQNKLSNIYTLTSVIGPVVVSLLYLFLAIDFSAFIWWHLFVDVAATIILIATLLFLFYKLDIIQRVIARIETSKEQLQKRIEALDKNIKRLEGNEVFYISATELIGKTMKSGKTDLESLSKVVIGAIYHNLSGITNGDNITINLYELRNSRIKMILSCTRLQYCERDSVDIPALYSAKDGLDISNSSIQDYYCIQCIRGKVRPKGGKFVIDDWKEMVEKFRWDNWEPGEKEVILRNGDRERCIEQGFRYNQYFAFKFVRDDRTVGYFEIIANEYTTIALDKEFDHITHKLKETYLPLLKILWDISDASAGKEPL